MTENVHQEDLSSFQKWWVDFAPLLFVLISWAIFSSAYWSITPIPYPKEYPFYIRILDKLPFFALGYLICWNAMRKRKFT